MRTLGVQVRGKINCEKSFSKELLCKKDNSTEINNQLDCFGSKEPHNDDTKSVILSDSERSHQRGDIKVSRHTEEQHLQSDTNISCHTERKRKYPLINSKELSCKKDNYIETNNQLDCFGSKEPHNDDNSRYSRHSECNEESHSRENITNNAILRGLNNCSPQNDRKNCVANWKKTRKVAFTEPSRGMSGAKVEQTSTETLSFRCVCERCRLTRGDVRKTTRKVAFTLAETLITLGIIGVVAAITIPTVINKYQSYVLKQQFRKAYSTLYNAIKLVQKDEPVACWYWDKSPYEAIECVDRNEYGTCIKWAMPNGKQTPSDYSGRFSDCTKFYENLRTTMKAVKYCPNNALKNGCITDNYRGMDKVNLEKNPDVAQDPEQYFSDSKMKNRYPAFITSDGVVYMYWSESSSPFFMFDINGHKGPNKWGYDIFDFSLRGNPNDGITKIGAVYGYTEKGGKNINTMIREF